MFGKPGRGKKRGGSFGGRRRSSGGQRRGGGRYSMRAQGSAAPAEGQEGAAPVVQAPIKPASYETLMERAIRLLTARARSIEELRGRLLDREDARPEEVQRVMGRLIELDYLDDARFAREYGAFKVRQGKIGPSRLRRRLEQLKVPEPLIAQATEEIFAKYSQGSLIEELIEKRLRSRGGLRSFADVQKLSDFLMRRGFSYDTIRDKTQQAWQQAQKERAEAALLQEEDQMDTNVDMEQERERMEEFVQKQLRIKGMPSNYKELRKISEKLMRRGFERDMIQERMDLLWEEAKS